MPQVPPVGEAAHVRPSRDPLCVVNFLEINERLNILVRHLLFALLDHISAVDLRSDGFLDGEVAGSGISDSEWVVDDRSGAVDRGCRRRFVDGQGVVGAIEEGGPCGLLEWRSDGVGHGSSL
ncbi:hypothetical protein ACLOJK_038946 [Asimina triloba]